MMDNTLKTFTEKDWPAFSRGEIKGERKIAAIPSDISSWLPTESGMLLLSQATAAKQWREHPDISPEDYRRIQAMLDGGEVRRDRKLHLGLINDQGDWYYAVIKATSTGKAAYLQSFRRSNSSDVERIRERSDLIRPEK